VVSFTPLPLYPRGKNPRYLLDRRLGGPQSRSGRHGEEKILDRIGTRTPTSRSSSPEPVAIPTTLSRLLLTLTEQLQMEYDHVTIHYCMFSRAWVEDESRAVLGRSDRGGHLHKLEIECRYFIETFVSLKSRNILYF
jgi:hypothetical protein